MNTDPINPEQQEIQEKVDQTAVISYWSEAIAQNPVVSRRTAITGPACVAGTSLVGATYRENPGNKKEVGTQTSPPPQ